MSDLDTPAGVYEQLVNNAFFTEDQALYVANTVYQPLKEEIELLEEKINDLQINLEHLANYNHNQ